MPAFKLRSLLNISRIGVDASIFVLDFLASLCKGVEFNINKLTEADRSNGVEYHAQTDLKLRVARLSLPERGLMDWN